MSEDGARADAVVMKRLLTVREAAAYVGLARGTLHNRICPSSKDPFPVRPKRIGRRVLFDIRDLDAYVDGLPIG